MKPIIHLFPAGSVEKGTGSPTYSGRVRKPGYRWSPAYSQAVPGGGTSQPLNCADWRGLGERLKFHPDEQSARRAADGVRVLFRVWPASQGGEVLALFPELPACPDGYHCQSYQHTGQHGAADPQHCIAATRPATLEEAAPLIRELESAPFHYSLRIIARTPADAYRTRRNDLKPATV